MLPQNGSGFYRRVFLGTKYALVMGSMFLLGWYSLAASLSGNSTWLIWIVVLTSMIYYYVRRHSQSSQKNFARRVIVTAAIFYLVFRTCFIIYNGVLGKLGQIWPFRDVIPYLVSQAALLSCIAVGYCAYKFLKHHRWRVVAFIALGVMYLHVALFLYYYNMPNMIWATTFTAGVILFAFLFERSYAFFTHHHPKTGIALSCVYFGLAGLLLLFTLYTTFFPRPVYDGFGTRSIGVKRELALLRDYFDTWQFREQVEKSDEAHRGNPEAMYYMGEVYKGLSTVSYVPYFGEPEPSLEYYKSQSVKWYSAAGLKGHDESKRKLVKLYMEGYKPDNIFHYFLAIYGIGISYNPVEAYYWASSVWCLDVKPTCSDLETMLTPEQIEGVKTRLQKK